MQREFSYDPLTGTREIFYGHGDGSFSIRTVQDAAPVLRQAQIERDAFDGRRHDWYKVATLPSTEILRQCQEWGVRPYSPEWKERLRKQVLNSNEYRNFRIWGGRV